MKLFNLGVNSKGVFNHGTSNIVIEIEENEVAESISQISEEAFEIDEEMLLSAII